MIKQKITVTRREACALLAAGLCLSLGLILFIAFPGFDFSGLIFLGLGGVILLYWLLARLSRTGRKGAKLMTLLLTLCLALGLTAAGITGGEILRASRGAPETDCPYLVVLGAGVNGTKPSLSLQNRLDAAYAYLAAHPDTLCVVSGGQGGGEDISEAECMFRELTARGIGESRILKEEAAVNTRENIRFSLDLIAQRTGTRPDTIGLVSSEYHLCRASHFARAEGVTAVGIPGETSWFLLKVNYLLREIAAMWYYRLFGF